MEGAKGRGRMGDITHGLTFDETSRGKREKKGGIQLKSSRHRLVQELKPEPRGGGVTTLQREKAQNPTDLGNAASVQPLRYE